MPYIEVRKKLNKLLKSCPQSTLNRTSSAANWSTRVLLKLLISFELLYFYNKNHTYFSNDKSYFIKLKTVNSYHHIILFKFIRYLVFQLYNSQMVSKLVFSHPRRIFHRTFFMLIYCHIKTYIREVYSKNIRMICILHLLSLETASHYDQE